MSDGPKEEAVRATLATRDAGILDALPHNVLYCLLGLFAGARSPGRVVNGNLFVGKAECEWDWEETWTALKNAGLVEWSTTERPNHPRIGGTTIYLDWLITEKGSAARDDYWRWSDELMIARAEDRAPSSETPPPNGA